MLNEQLKRRVFPTLFKYLRKYLKKWLKLCLLKSQVDTHLSMIHPRINLQILNYEVVFLRSSVDCVRRLRRWNPRRRTIRQIQFNSNARSSVLTTSGTVHTHQTEEVPA